MQPHIRPVLISRTLNVMISEDLWLRRGWSDSRPDKIYRISGVVSNNIVISYDGYGAGTEKNK